MKKIIVALALMLGLGTVAVAQEATQVKTEKSCCKKDKKSCDKKDKKSCDKKEDGCCATKKSKKKSKKSKKASEPACGTSRYGESQCDGY